MTDPSRPRPDAPEPAVGQTWKDRDPRTPVIVTVTRVTERHVHIRRGGRDSYIRRDRFPAAFTFVPSTEPAA